MQDKSLYDVLGVSSDATHEQIRQAFLSLAHRFHPDLSSGPANEERFKQLRYAYEILSSVERRELYDLSLHSYANAIRQSSESMTQSKSDPRRWTQPSHSTFSFKTQWLKDRAIAREKWLFVGLAFATVGLIFLGSHYLSRLRTTFEQPRKSMPNNVAAVEIEIPTNEMPKVAPNFRKHFKDVEPAAEENIESPRQDEILDDIPDPIARLQRKLKSRSDEAEWTTFSPEAVFSKHVPMHSVEPLPLDARLPPLPIYRHIQTLDASQRDVSNLPTENIPATLVPTARIELRADFWDGSHRFRDALAAPLIQDRMPSQRELADAMRTNAPGLSPTNSFDGFSTGRTADPIDYPSYNYNQTNYLPYANPGFEPRPIPRFAPPQVPRFSPPSVTNGIYGNL